MNDKREPQAASWRRPLLRRIGTIRDIAFKGGINQQGSSVKGNNERS